MSNQEFRENRKNQLSEVGMNGEKIGCQKLESVGRISYQKLESVGRINQELRDNKKI